MDETEVLPGFLQDVIKKYPEVWKSFQGLGRAVGEVDGIDVKARHLVKLGIAIGAQTEGAVHSHVRRCREAGVSDAEIYHAALLAISTIGWPSAIAALSWIDDIIGGIKGQ
ncbi:MAG: carboxymuconolactone decarboxylase family protein [Thermodesulfobacteriota bacterium]